MSTVKSRSPLPPGWPDEYRYGYREVPQMDARGRVIDYVRIPLTEEDVLHPQEGDVILNNEDHATDCNYLHNAFVAQLRHDPQALVLCDVGIFWDNPILRHHAPDVTVIFGVRPDREGGGMFYVGPEGARPALVIEITSPSTRNVDFRRKRRQYYLALVPTYVIVDAHEGDGERTLEIIGYRRGPTRYQRLPLNDHGRVWLDAVQLWLGSEGRRVACYDEQGRRIPDVAELTEANELAQQEIRELADANELAQQKIRELEAELHRLRDKP